MGVNEDERDEDNPQPRHPNFFNINMVRPIVEEVLSHPTYPTAVWKLKPTKSGMLPVAIGRGGPFNICWEVHGSGDIKLVWVMGLGAIMSAWQRQTLRFGHDLGDKYSCLVLDNRGMGRSDKPIMRYSTSEMAKDILEVLDHLGWTSERQLHLLGVSMGGMIALEIANLIPTRLCSLNLISTAARIQNTTTFLENLRTRVNMFVPKSLDRAVADAARSLFPDTWLDSPDDCIVPSASTPNVELPPNGAYLRFGTNYERFAAQELTKRLDTQAFTKKGFVLQAIAAGWHYRSKEQLESIADRVGRERILVMHGTRDNMITVEHGRVLIEELQPRKSFLVEGAGHVLMLERMRWYNEAVEEMVTETEKMEKK